MKRSRGSSVRGARVGASGAATRKRGIDFSDIPELSTEQLAAMRRVGRPALGRRPRVQISIRVDPDVLGWVRELAARRGLGYQTLINAILEKQMKRAG